MIRQPVQSSNLKSVGYDPDRQLLEIEFLDGSVYQYEGVPGHMHVQLMQASSPGSFFHRFIKDKYPYRKIQ